MFAIVIPARMSSVRLPNKPLQNLGGQPLVVRVAERAKKSKATEIWVATDHSDIQKVVEDTGFKSILTDSQHPNGTSRLEEVVRRLNWPDDRIVVNVQGDEPFMHASLIDSVADALMEKTDWLTATVAVPLTDAADFFNPAQVKVVCDRTGRALYFSRASIPWARDHFSSANRETLPKDFPSLRHLGLYGYRVGTLKCYSTLTPSPLESLESLEQLRWLWNGIPMGVVVGHGSPEAGIDTPEDMERARKVWEKNPL